MDERPIFVDSHESFARFFINGWIVDGRDGGLVVGRRHSEGHIFMLQSTDNLGQFSLAGYMEGGEYIMSPDATANHMERLVEINKDNAPCNTVPVLNPNSRILNTRAEPHDKFLVIQ